MTLQKFQEQSTDETKNRGALNIVNKSKLETLFHFKFRVFNKFTPLAI
jgi:hypothetical protein